MALGLWNLPLALVTLFLMYVMIYQPPTSGRFFRWYPWIVFVWGCGSLAILVSLYQLSHRIGLGVVHKLGLDARASWWVDVASPERFDVSIRRLQRKALKKTRSRPGGNQ